MADEPGHPIATIAALLDLTERRVQQLSQQGVIPRLKHGRYSVTASVHAYIRYLRERAMQGDAAGADQIAASRAALMKARARTATLEADQLDGRLLLRADVEKAWVTIMSAMRSRLLAVPSTTAQSIIYLTTPSQIASLLTQAISEALDDISNIPVYATGVPGLPGEAGGDDKDSAEGDEAAAEADGVGVG
jgi:phage terminase Nu1 subunit (DNA packaging protein)